MNDVQVIVVDNHELVAKSLDIAIRPYLVEYGFSVLAPVPGVERVPPIGTSGIAVCDVALEPGLSGADAVRHLRGQGWTVLLISGEAPPARVLDAIAAGARGYVDKSVPEPAVLVEAIVTLADGGWHLSSLLAAMFYEDMDRRPLQHREELSYADREVLKSFTRGETSAQVASARNLTAVALQQVLARIFAAETARRRSNRLTRTELEIVKIIGCHPDISTAQVAERLHIEVNTVNTHLKAIREKYYKTHAMTKESAPRQRVIARLWAAELGLCAGDKRT
ncbi:winged helix-turn-helix transcriptional regulator [Nonomuraea wenchangensis]